MMVSFDAFADFNKHGHTKEISVFIMNTSTFSFPQAFCKNLQSTLKCQNNRKD